METVAETMIVLLTIVSYAAAWACLFNAFSKRETVGLIFKGFVYTAISLHAISSYFSIVSSEGIQLGFFQVASAFFVVMNTIVAISALKRPLDKLFLILLPFTCISLLLAEFIYTRAPMNASLSYPILAHILLSVIAYSLLTIATLQAILLRYQNSQLKQHHVKSVLGVFPPLQTMESLLFDLVWAGFALLSLSIATGVFFIEDMFAQKLTHKTAFSIISWVLYAILLAGRHALGWRGRVATRWVIAGFVMLMLAYFGTKFALEIVLNRA